MLVGSIERSHRGRVFALSKQKRSIIIAFRRRAQNKRVWLQPNCRQKNKKKHRGVPRTKTSRVFGRPFLRWTRRSRSKFAKPISRNVVASSFRSWKPTLSRSCEGWTGREKPFFFLSMRAVMRMMKFCTCSSKRFSSSLIFWIDLLLLPLFLFSVKLRKPALFELLYQKK